MTLQAFRSVIFQRSEFAQPIFTGSRVVGEPERVAGAVTATADRIRTAGVRRGLLIAADSGAFLTGLLALFRAGAEVVLPPNMRPGTLEELSGTFDGVITDQPVPGATCIVVAEGGTARADAATDLAALKITFCTSGSQGTPKRIQKTAAMLEHEAIALEAAWGTKAKGASTFAMVPHYHMYGMTFKLIWPLLAGRTFAAPMYEFWEDALRALEPNAFLITGPAHLERLSGLQPIDSGRRPAIVLSAGGAVSNAAATATNRIFGVPLTEVFGSTEGGAVAWRDRSDEGAAWTAFPSVTVSADDGYLTVRSPYSLPERTEDRVDLLDEIRFVFLGRGDRVVKIEGKRINLTEIEARLIDHPWVSDAATVVLSGPGRTQIGAVVVPSPAGREALARESVFRVGAQIRRDLERFIDASILPRRWKVVDAMPANTMGKRSSDLLAELFEERHLPILRREQRNGAQTELTLWVPEGLTAFDGHFPGYSVLPGVVQLQWAIAYSRRCFDLDAASPQQLRVKFRQIVVPNCELRLRLECDAAKRRLSFTYDSERGEHSSGSWRF